MSRTLNILLLCEGDAETRDSWSGTSKSVVDHLRRRGHTVFTGDVDLYGLERIVALLATWSPRRYRWWVKYHLGSFPFFLRSARARRHIQRHADQVDLILQFGATFAPRGRGTVPFALYCDGNAKLAETGEAGGEAEVNALTPEERRGVVEREAGVYREAALILTLSERLAGSFRNDFSVPAGQVKTIHAGPNIELTEIPVPGGRPRSGPPTVLFVGRAFQRKGGDLLLSAFRDVRARMPEAELVIVGPDAAPSPEPGVRYLGFLRKDDPAEWARLAQAYSAADVFCVPTRYEPFGIVFVEAMLFGLPCVGPDAWAVPEIIEDEETGVLVPPEDKVALADALVGLLTDSDRAEKMGRAGRQRALDRFTWESVVDGMVAALTEVADAEVPATSMKDGRASTEPAP